MFGYQIPETFVAERGEILRYFGARAIFSRGSVDILPDRKMSTLLPGDEKIIAAAGDDYRALRFLEWIELVGLPYIRKETANLDQSSDKIVKLVEGRFSIHASPQSSCGYLYIGAAEHLRPKGRYSLNEPDLTATWSGSKIPALGDRVHVKMNSYGPGTVIGYFVESGERNEEDGGGTFSFLGLHVKVDKPPQWHLKQNKNTPYICVYGVEVNIL